MDEETYQRLGAIAQAIDLQLRVLDDPSIVGITLPLRDGGPEPTVQRADGSIATFPWRSGDTGTRDCLRDAMRFALLRLRAELYGESYTEEDYAAEQAEVAMHQDRQIDPATGHWAEVIAREQDG